MKNLMEIVLVLLIFVAATSACGKDFSDRQVSGGGVPTRPNLLEMANKAFKAGDYPRAIRLYKEYLQSGNPNRRDEAHFRLALAYTYQSQYEAALQHFRAVNQSVLTSEQQSQLSLLMPLLEKSERDENEKQRLKEIVEKLKRVDT